MIWKRSVPSLTLLLMLATSTHAGMTVLSTQRSISSSATQLDETRISTDGTEPFQEDLLTSGYVREDGSIVGSVSTIAFQTSVLSDDQLRGLGRGSGFGSGLRGEAQALGNSQMEVVFEVDTAMKYTLVGQLRATPHGLGLNGSSAFVRLSSAEGVLFDIRMDEANPPTATGVVDFTGADTQIGLLDPGLYTLEAFAEGVGSHGKNRCADFDFTFSAVERAAIPEPTSLLMLAIGILLGLARYRK